MAQIIHALIEAIAQVSLSTPDHGTADAPNFRCGREGQKPPSDVGQGIVQGVQQVGGKKPRVHSPHVSRFNLGKVKP